MTKAGAKLLEAATDALAIARGEIPAARITIDGHHYVPEDRWQPPETAPRNRSILVWGKPDDDDDRGVRFLHPGVHAAYWDEIDSAFCIKGADWTGPFIKPLCWMDEPAPPALMLSPSSPPSPGSS